jgi:hypothetical protein
MGRLLACIFFGPLGVVWCLIKDGAETRRLRDEVAKLRHAREVEEFLRDAGRHRKT